MTEPADHEWLLARERGDDVSQVPEARRAPYRQLEQLVAALPDPAPPAGWKRRVLEAIDQPAPTSAPLPARRARRWAALAALAAVILLWCVLRLPAQRDPPPQVAASLRPDGPTVATEIRAGSVRRSTGAAHLGDTLVVTAEADAPIELRLYGDADEPIARCTDRGGCTVAHTGSHRRYVLEQVLRSHGTVRVMLFTGAAFPATFERLDADVASAHAHGGEARQVAATHVE